VAPGPLVPRDRGAAARAPARVAPMHENGPASEEAGPSDQRGRGYSAGLVTVTPMVPPVFCEVTVTVTPWPAT